MAQRRSPLPATSQTFNVVTMAFVAGSSQKVANLGGSSFFCVRFIIAQVAMNGPFNPTHLVRSVRRGRPKDR